MGMISAGVMIFENLCSLTVANPGWDLPFFISPDVVTINYCLFPWDGSSWIPQIVNSLSVSSVSNTPPKGMAKWTRLRSDEAHSQRNKEET